MRPRSGTCSAPGSQGIGYLIERDGFLFQSPITWYVQQRRWDLSPGYEMENAHFDRPVAVRRACTATRTGPSRWRERSTGIGRRSSRATRSAASGATGPASSTSRGPKVVDGRDTTIVNPAGLEPVAPGRRLRAMPLAGPSARREGRPSGRGLPARTAVRSVLDGLRDDRRHGERPVRRPGGADAREPLLPGQRGRARRASPATIRIGGPSPTSGRTTTGSGAWNATPIRGCCAAGRGPPGAEPRRRLHRLPHAAVGAHRHSPRGHDEPPHPPPARRRGTVPDGPGGTAACQTVTGLISPRETE